MASSTTFSIKAAPGTDIWRKPPSTDVFNAPTSIPPQNQTSSSPLRTKGPLPSFLSARLSFIGSWKYQYDQGGLLLSFRRANFPTTPTKHVGPEKWIKTGVELYNGRPRLSTVACDAWADWSVADLPGNQGDWATVLVERDTDVSGTSLWVYRIDGETGEKVPLREVCWVFGDGDEWEVEVACMAARPGDVGGELAVEFRDFEVTWKE